VGQQRFVCDSAGRPCCLTSAVVACVRMQLVTEGTRAVLCVAGWPASGLGIVGGEQIVSLSTWSSHPRTTLGVLSCKLAGSKS